MGPLQYYLHGPQFKWAPNNNIDPGGRGSLNFMLSNQFTRITQMKLRVFILKVANSEPRVNFL